MIRPLRVRGAHEAIRGRAAVTGWRACSCTGHGPPPAPRHRRAARRCRSCAASRFDAPLPEPAVEARGSSIVSRRTGRCSCSGPGAAAVIPNCPWPSPRRPLPSRSTCGTRAGVRRSLPANLTFEKLQVRLREPISGRALVGQSLDEAPAAVRVPRVVQLDAKDTRFALRAQGLRPTGIRSGALTWQAPWPGSAVRGDRPNEVYLSNPVPEPRPAVLGRYGSARSRAATARRARSAIPPISSSIDEARWKRVWRS